MERRWLLLALMLIGLGQGSYFFWAARSALAAAPVFHASESCNAPALVSSATIAAGACRLELVTVISATYSSSRSGRTYQIATLSADGAQSHVLLAGTPSMALWRRVHPMERVVLQRFTAPGYYLTGRITAIADSAGAAMTRYHPDSGTHYEGMYAAVGMLLFACTFTLCVL
jgi:hypothetical protein